MSNLPHIYFLGRTVQCGGYRSVAMNYLAAFESAGLDYSLISTDLLRSPASYEPFSTLTSNPVVAIMYDTPDMLSRVNRTGKSVKLIGATLFETDSLPAQWLNPLLSADEVWVPTDFNIRSFAAGGLPRDNLRKVPLCLDTRPYDSGGVPMKIAGRKSFAFLYSFAYPSRKDPRLLLRAYFRAFTAKDNVCLVLKMIPGLISIDELFASLMPEYDIKHDDSLPRLITIAEDFPRDKMISLFNACDVYVTSERAKGWDYPAMEMMALGKPCVSIDWSGSTEFITSDNSFLVPHTGRFVNISKGDVVPDAYPLYQGHHWPEVDVDVFAHVMREAYEDSDKRARLAAAAKDHVRSRYSHDVVGRLIRDILKAYEFPRERKPSVLSLSGPQSTVQDRDPGNLRLPQRDAPGSPQTKPLTLQDKAVALLEQLVIERLASFADRYPRLGIFPFGAHTRWLITIMKKGQQQGRIMPHVVCLMDDFPAVVKVDLPWGGSAPVINPAKCQADTIDAILISSDASEASLATRMRALLPAAKPVLEIYQAIQTLGPFERNRITS